MDDGLKKKLAKVEDDLRGLREDRAQAVKARDDAKEAYAAIPDGDDDQEAFDAAKEKVAAVGVLDEQIAGAQTKQVELLKMLGDKEALQREKNGGNPAAISQLRNAVEGWSSATALADADLRGQLEAISSSKARFGSLQIGEVASREVMVADIADGLLPAQRESRDLGLVRAIQRPLSILDLIPTGVTDGNSVPYTQESALTGGAEEQVEGSAKAELYFDFDDADAPVRTIAGYMKVRKQALADFGGLQSIIDSRLRYLVRKRLEAQVVAGDGSGSNLEGILQTSGIGTVAYNASVPMTEQILSGITNIILNDGDADGVVLNPVDWQTALTEKADNGSYGSLEYMGGGPFGSTASSIWGVPLTPSQAISSGAGLVADWALGASLLIREGVNVLLSDSDQDDFIKNRVTMLGEMRAALLVWRPALFQEVEFE